MIFYNFNRTVLIQYISKIYRAKNMECPFYTIRAIFQLPRFGAKKWKIIN